MKNSFADFMIIGAGIIGLNIARELKKRYPNSKVIVIEKENNIGEHASGRNSGVLHAGFYYTKDSLKAKFTKEGNAILTQYCLDKKIPINRCGKLVVAQDTNDLNGMYELLQRAKHNRVPIELISAKEAETIEPRVKTTEYALFSPTTSSVDPRVVLANVLEDAKHEGIIVHLGTQYLNNKNNMITTNKGIYTYGYVINAAGLYADKIARDFGFSKNYYILPFKGLYLYSSETLEKLNTHVYPVPVLENPFLGVHFTLDAHGKMKIGPTAIPAFWREQYQGLSRFSIKELSDILWREATLFLQAGFNFRQLAWNEIRKYNRKVLVNHASQLIKDIKKSDFITWGKPGIRAQLFNIKTRRLEMDFILEGNTQSFHILNAVSPAFTCSIPFSKYTVDRIQALIEKHSEDTPMHHACIL